jgi:hypothetical protein
MHAIECTRTSLLRRHLSCQECLLPCAIFEIGPSCHHALFWKQWPSVASIWSASLSPGSKLLWELVFWCIPTICSPAKLGKYRSLHGICKKSLLLPFASCLHILFHGKYLVLIWSSYNPVGHRDHCFAGIGLLWSHQNSESTVITLFVRCVGTCSMLRYLESHQPWSNGGSRRSSKQKKKEVTAQGNALYSFLEKCVLCYTSHRAVGAGLMVSGSAKLLTNIDPACAPNSTSTRRSAQCLSLFHCHYLCYTRRWFSPFLPLLQPVVEYNGEVRLQLISTLAGHSSEFHWWWYYEWLIHC